MRILVTCPPMLKQIEVYRPIFEEKNIELIAPQVIQVMTEYELIEILPTMDGWIIGDDPATERVFADRKSTRLNSSHDQISYAVFCLKKKNTKKHALLV